MVGRSLERTVAITLMGLLIAITVILTGITGVRGDPQLLVGANAVATLAFGAILVFYLRGWQVAPLVLIGLLTILPVAFLNELTPAAALACLVPPAVAIIFAQAQWVMLSGLVSLGGVAIRNSVTAFELSNATFFVIGFLVISAMAVARRVLDDAREQAIQQAAAAEQARIQAEQATAESQANNRLLQERTTQQQQLIELLNNLEVPTTIIQDGVLFMPIVGALDTRRAKRLMEVALSSVHTNHARMLILDIAGMPIVDTASAKALSQAVSAVKLLGCTVVISGLRSDVAQTLAELQIDMPNVQFVRSLSDVFKSMAPPHAGGDSIRN